MLRRLGRGVGWEELVRALELVKGEPWGEFRDRMAIGDGMRLCGWDDGSGE
jgi:hypothetical protein